LKTLLVVGNYKLQRKTISLGGASIMITVKRLILLEKKSTHLSHEETGTQFKIRGEKEKCNLGNSMFNILKGKTSTS